MMIEQLLGETPVETFFGEHYLKLPLARAGGCEHLRRQFDFAAAARVLTHPQADLVISRDGARADRAAPQTPQDVRELLADGYALGVRHAHEHDEALAGLAAAFAADFRAAIDVHLYCTPAGRPGFSWHYDAEEVFVLQTAGSKEWQLRKNTVNPWPLVETLPQDMRYEREIMPLLRCNLAAGDWLYIPTGYWHRTEAGEESISLSVGVLAPAAIDAFDFLRSELVGSLRWRQRLPPSCPTANESERREHAAQLRELFTELGGELAARLGSEEFANQFLARPIS
jgi:50S ribosomal protein L16 3-hydroxylase